MSSIAGFAREESAGRVDVAVTYARNLLAILFPGDLCFAAPVVYTHAPDGVIFTVQADAASVVPAPAPAADLGQSDALAESLRSSAALNDDLAWTDQRQLEGWRLTLTEAADAYHRHLADPALATQEAVHQGLTLIQQRLKIIGRPPWRKRNQLIHRCPE